MSDDKVVASYRPPQSLLDAFLHLYKKVHRSVGPSVGRSFRRLVRHTRVEFLGNGPNLNKIASGIRMLR